MTGIPDQDVTQAVLRNDLQHLTVAVELMRGDFRDMVLEVRGWRKEQEKVTYTLATQIQDIKSQLKVVKWIGGVVVTVVIALVVGWAKRALGI